MTLRIKAAASLSMSGLLLGCAQLATPSSPAAGPAPGAGGAPARVLPVRMAAAAAVTPAMPAPEAWYSSGRSAHGAGQLALALGHYEKALALEPDHVGALNALAVVHAQLDRTDEALKLFARARQLAPGVAHIHNNAGYALMRAGRLEEAEPALKLALALDPQSVPTRQNLELLARAQAERGPAGPTAQLPEAAALPALPTPAAPRLVRVSPQVYSLELPAATVVAQAKPEPAIAMNADPSAVRKPGGGLPGAAGAGTAESGLAGIRLEVSNGAGIARLARRTAERLALAGVSTARLTNALPYQQARTEIQFARGQEAAAQALQSRLPLAARAVASGQMPAGMQLRLVLGHDASSQAIAAWLDAPPVQETAAAGQEGWRWS